MRKWLQSKLAELMRQRDQNIANLNAIEGAIQLVNAALAEIEQQEKPPELTNPK